jgi:hypothetical protein
VTIWNGEERKRERERGEDEHGLCGVRVCVKRVSTWAWAGELRGLAVLSPAEAHANAHAHLMRLSIALEQIHKRASVNPA